MAAAALGEAAGIILVYAILAGFLWSRDKPLQDRAFAIGAPIFLLGVLVLALLQ